MREEFLHYIWKFGLFEKSNLTTTCGKTIQIVKAGLSNTNSGPDFFNAKIYIDDALWAGNVEIHVNESDWQRHGHQYDEAYNNVILHVVYDSNATTLNSNDKEIPVLSLKNRISLKQFELYQRFLDSKLYIPCSQNIKSIDKQVLNSWLERVLVERLERKSLDITSRLNRNRGDWFQTFWEHLSMTFGFKVNALPFEMLAINLPYKLLEKYRHSLILTEALIFGQAGMLNEIINSEYYRQLQNEYAFLQKKHQLVPMSKSAWKFGRMRPGNFPTVRMAQLAVLIFRHGNLFNRLIDSESLAEVTDIFEVEASSYWNDHYVFEEKKSKSYVKALGKNSIDIIEINVVVPFLFSYARHLGDENLADRSMRFLESIKAEDNSIVRGFAQLGIAMANAGGSQSLLELKSKYCDQKKCLNCTIGVQLIKES